MIGRRSGHRVDVLTTDTLVRGDNCFFAATGITDGPLLDGVRFDARGSPPRAWSCGRAAAPCDGSTPAPMANLQVFSDVDYCSRRRPRRPR